MKKTIAIVIAALFSACLFVGCGEVANDTVPESTVAPTVTPTSKARTEYEVVLKDAPPDFEIDSRYTFVDFGSDTPPLIYEDNNNRVDPPISDSMIAFGLPTFNLYMYYDSKGIAQFRAYGEKYEVTWYDETRKTMAEKPVESGIYKVIPTMETENGKDIMVYRVLDMTPVNIEDEDFPAVETAGQKNNPAQSTPPTTKAPTSGSSDKGTRGSTGSNTNSGSSGSGNSGGGNSGGGNGNSGTGSGGSWHDAVYEDVWIVDVPAGTREEPIYETVEWFECNCGATFSSESEIGAHADQHLMNGEPDAYKIKSETKQVGTNSIPIPEQGHWEKKLINESGYY